MKKIIIAGGRDLCDFSKCSKAEGLIKNVMVNQLVIRLGIYIKQYFLSQNIPVTIISGRCGRSNDFDPYRDNYAKGGDGIGECVAVSLGCPVESYPADWKKHGKPGGMIRNGTMAQSAYKSDGGMLIALPGGKGTDNMVTQARKVGLEIIDLRKLI